MYKYLHIIVLFCATSFLHAAEPVDEVILWNTPQWVVETLEKSGLNNKYRFSSKVNPFYLRGDFDGDGAPDISILIEEINTNKIGIAVFHSQSHEIHIIGAGTKLGNGGENYKWMDMWSVYKQQEVGQGVGEGKPPTLISEALYVGKSEAASAIIYWNGKNYIWYQQGD